MKLFSLRRRGSDGRRFRFTGHIEEEPQISGENGTRSMAFRLSEVPGVEFHLKMYPTTPRHHRGDRVAIEYRLNGAGVAEVETLFSYPDAAELRRQRKEYLKAILRSEEDTKH